MSPRLEKFDRSMVNITGERDKKYGSPELNFSRIAKLKEVVKDCPDPLARHALEMICIKVARLIHSPDHLDSWIDIAGYARCGAVVSDDPMGTLPLFFWGVGDP